MKQIQELMEKRKQAWEGAKAFVEAKKDKDGLMSDEDVKTYSEMEKRSLTSPKKSSVCSRWKTWSVKWRNQCLSL